MKRLLFVAIGMALMAPALSAAPPNIVFIMTDDQGEWATGHAGHPQSRTPNLDRLAREGARLVNCFAVTPVCSPSRASLISSRHDACTEPVEGSRAQHNRLYNILADQAV